MPIAIDFARRQWPMTVQSTRAQKVSAPTGSVEFDADVLVIGGGPAGTWAAISAAEQGARVVLADKGFCGTSGATAAAGTGVWYVDPERKEVDVYPKANAKRKKTVGIGGMLDGGDVLPGFTLPVAKIFEKRAPAKKPGKKGKK